MKSLANVCKNLLNSKYLKLSDNPEQIFSNSKQGTKSILKDNYFKDYFEDKEKFYEKNKEEVLYLYRHFLKNIPQLEKTLLRQVYLKEEIKFIFREHSRESIIEIIMKHKVDAYVIVEKINKNVYPPFPQFYTI